MNRPARIVLLVSLALAGCWGGVLAGEAQAAGQESARSEKPRPRALGLAPGVFDPGPYNAITDVDGVTVGHVTLRTADSVRTGVTAIRPHPGNLFQDKVPAGLAVGNGFGKFAGATQAVELGEIETPVVLTNTLSVAEGIAGVVEWTLAQPGNEGVRSVNAVVGETNDGYLNDIRARRVRASHVVQAIEACRGGPVAEGCVGAGTGTQAFGWKGGIGTSSRVLPARYGGYALGVLVQTNYDGVLTLDGAPVGRELGRHAFGDGASRLGPAADVASPDAARGQGKKPAKPQEAGCGPSASGPSPGDGSVVIVIATDAPLSDRNLTRLARRAFLGVGRTGSCMANGSGDYALAFSTSGSVRRTPERRAAAAQVTDLPNQAMTPLFQAVVEAVEEAVASAMLQAVTTTGFRGHRLEALPPEAVEATLARHGLARPRP